MRPDPCVVVPAPLDASVRRYFGAAGDSWLASVPTLVGDCLDRWQLRLDGPPAYGLAALVLPVRCADGTPTALKLQPPNDESAGEWIALRTWDGHGAVQLLAHEPGSGALLLERLDPDRSLSTVEDDMAALQILTTLLARLSAVAAPAGLRRLGDVAAQMLEQVPWVLTRLVDSAERDLVGFWASMLREVLPSPGDRLLHWDLHYDNVLAPHPSAQREPWLAIDPKPLAGDPGFELSPALGNRWDEMVATGDLARAIRRRFDVMTDIMGLDRQQALRWTMGRVVQNVVWDVEAGETVLNAELVAMADALSPRSERSRQ